MEVARLFDLNKGVKAYSNINRLYSYLLAILSSKDAVVDIFLNGRTRVPIRYLLVTSLLTIFADLETGMINVKGHYL
jgi:hypothetical protein